MKIITNETRMLRYNFTPEEHLTNTAEMARLYDALIELEGNHKSIKASLKEQEEATGAELGRMARIVRDKCDHRKIECQWQMNRPADGQKTLFRLDSYETVEVRRMEDFEKQETLDLQPDTYAEPQGLTPEVPKEDTKKKRR